MPSPSRFGVVGNKALPPVPLMFSKLSLSLNSLLRRVGFSTLPGFGTAEQHGAPVLCPSRRARGTTEPVPFQQWMDWTEKAVNSSAAKRLEITASDDMGRYGSQATVGFSSTPTELPS